MEFGKTDDGRKGKITAILEGKNGGEVTYVWAGPGKLILDHTEVFQGFEGKGIGKALVMQVVELAKEKQVKIVPLCPYAKSLFEKSEDLKNIEF